MNKASTLISQGENPCLKPFISNALLCSLRTRRLEQDWLSVPECTIKI